MTIVDYISRWWQSKGFGIQSKSDFAYLHDVIKESSRYYAYNEMDAAFPNASSEDTQSAQLLFRLLNNALGTHITIVGQLSPMEQMACRLSKAEPTIVGTFHNLHAADLVIVKSISTDNSELWQQILQARTVTFDIKASLGICLIQKERYPQHYRI